MNTNKIKASTLRPVHAQNSLVLYEYTPTLFRPLYQHFEPMSLTRRIRYLFEYLHKAHYRVYYLEVNGTVVGHCVVAPGGRRLKCSTPADIVVGPYYIAPHHRGNGYAKRLLELTLAHCAYPFEYAYDWIAKDNIASLKTSESCGFEIVAALNVVGKRRRLVPDGNGAFWVLRKSNT